MSISVPTAAETESQRPLAGGGGPRWSGWLAVLVLVLIVVALWDRDPSVQAPGVDEVEPPTANFPDALELADSAVPELRTETFFPGDGVFTAHAGSIHGQVAVGQRSRTPGAFVYTTDPTGEMWTPGSLEVAERAWLGDVSPWMDTFILGGAIAGPGMGSSVPTLWSGTVAGEFRVLEHPFEGPGRVDRLRVVGGDLYLMGQGAAPFTDTRDSGSARFGRLLVGRPGAWRDITPDGFNIIVNDVVRYGDGVVAVGGDTDGAVLWWLAAGSDEWGTIDLGEGVATAATMTPEEGLVVSVVTVSAEAEMLSGLFAGDAPGSLAPTGTPIRARLGRIEPYDGGVVGTSVVGDASADLWWYRFGEGWTTIGVGAGGLDRVVLDASPTPDLVAFGSTADQPAIWSGGISEPQVLDGSTDPEWEFVSLLPGGATQVLDIGTHLFAYRNTLDAETVWVSSGGPWHAIETVDGFGLAGATGTEDGWAMFGETDTTGVVISVSVDEPLSTQLVPGASLRYAERSGSVLTVLATTDAGPVRIEFVDGAERVREPLDHLPARILHAPPILVGGEFGTGSVTISRDEGRSWVRIPGIYAAVGWTGLRTLLVSEDGLVSVLDPETLDVMPLANVDPSRAIVWDDGILVYSGVGVRFVDLSDGEMTDVGVGAESGIDGVFEHPIAGPGGLAAVTERGLPALYRWVGTSR